MLFGPSPLPHVVHVLGSMGTGGAQALVLHLATSPELQAYRHSIICIMAKQGDFLELSTQYGVPVYECLLRWPRSTPIPSYRINKWLRNHLYFTFSKRMADLLKRIDASLVHTHVTAEMLLQARASQRAGLPWAWTLHGLYRSRGEDTSDWPRTVELVNRSHSAITAVSQAALNEVTVDAIAAPGKTRVIPNGIDSSKFNYLSIERNPNWREQWHIPSDVVVFGAAGRLIEVKRHDLFVDAAAELMKQSSSAHFVIAGEGPLRTALEERIERLDLESQFHLVGHQVDMPRFLREIDVMVVSSDSEGFPMILLEACAMRVPCIATAVGGVPEVLRDGAGLLVQPGSVEALTEAMKCMQDSQERARYAEQARAVAEFFSIEAVSKQYAELYRELLEG